jgi:hypothetical protein
MILDVPLPSSSGRTTAASKPGRFNVPIPPGPWRPANSRGRVDQETLNPHPLLARDLPVYSAPKSTMADVRFDEFADEWQPNRPAARNDQNREWLSEGGAFGVIHRL